MSKCVCLIVVILLGAHRTLFADCGPMEPFQVTSASGEYILQLEYDRENTHANSKILSRDVGAACFRFKLLKVGELQHEGLLWGLGHHIDVLVPDSGDCFALCDPHEAVGIYDSQGQTIALYHGNDFLELSETLRRPYASGCHPEGVWDDGRRTYQLIDDQHALQLTTHSGRRVAISLTTGKITSGAPFTPAAMKRFVEDRRNPSGISWGRVGLMTLLGCTLGSMGFATLWVLRPRARSSFVPKKPKKIPPS